jgi:5-methylcytosine-specific restriction protein A
VNLPKPLDRRQRNREYDAKRKDTPGRRFYDLAIWRGSGGLREQQLQRQPLCERHLARGEVVAANTVNHRKAHKGNWDLFCDPANHESTCKDCHDVIIQGIEARGFEVGCDASGRPIDAAHPWTRGRGPRISGA